MGREIQIVWAGRHRRGPWESLCEHYRKRIRRFVPIRDRPIKVRGAADGVERRREEGRALLAALPDPVWSIALDENGTTLTSEELAAELTRLNDEWPHPIAFLIGSDLGLDPAVPAASRRVLSLGPMTLTHELARLVLYEQVYRGLSIGAGINYHRGQF